jgi:DNA topoisomerase-2
MSVEKKFKKLDDVSHVLLRPGMYIGSIKPHTSKKCLYNEGKMESEEITYNPGFLKIFDETVTNSVDEFKREGSRLNTIKVNINGDTISIWDNGGIPVVKHPDDNEWIPEMIFSNLKAGSNFNDDENRTGAGTNGVFGGPGGSGVLILSIPTSFYTGIVTGAPNKQVYGATTILAFTATNGSYTA